MPRPASFTDSLNRSAGGFGGLFHPLAMLMEPVVFQFAIELLKLPFSFQVRLSGKFLGLEGGQEAESKMERVVVRRHGRSVGFPAKAGLPGLGSVHGKQGPCQ